MIVTQIKFVVFKSNLLVNLHKHMEVGGPILMQLSSYNILDQVELLLQLYECSFLCHLTLRVREEPSFST